MGKYKKGYSDGYNQAVNDFSKVLLKDLNSQSKMVLTDEDYGRSEERHRIKKQIKLIKKILKASS